MYSLPGSPTFLELQGCPLAPEPWLQSPSPLQCPFHPSPVCPPHPESPDCHSTESPLAGRHESRGVLFQAPSPFCTVGHSPRKATLHDVCVVAFSISPDCDLVGAGFPERTLSLGGSLAKVQVSSVSSDAGRLQIRLRRSRFYSRLQGSVGQKLGLFLPPSSRGRERTGTENYPWGLLEQVSGACLHLHAPAGA